MSHIVSVKTKVTDIRALQRACAKLKLEAPVQGTFHVFSRNVTGVGVKLEGWNYPIVFDLKTGEAQFDNYGGRWGEQDVLDRFMQRHGIEAAKQLAEDRGLSYGEEYHDPEGNVCIDVDLTPVAAGVDQHIALGGENAEGGTNFAL